jgi:DNA processing protein
MSSAFYTALIPCYALQNKGLQTLFVVGMEDLLFKIALTQVPKVGPVLAKHLLRHIGSAEGVFKAKKRELERIPGIGAGITDAIRSSRALEHAERQVRLMERTGVKGVFTTDPAYPERLRHIADSPLMLYVRGEPDLNPLRSVGVIGTRQPTGRGTAFCEELVQSLAMYSPLIVSGLAYGIDVCAHRAALSAGLQTVGVLAHGLGTLYPNAHRQVAGKMLEQGGLVTEYLYETEVEREHFPMRNRIVAGLCDALVVVETAVQGGSMITVHFANEYHKDVFAVPGRVGDELSAGCNYLIKSNRAALLETASDLIDLMGWNDAENPDRAVQRQLFPELEEEDRKIVNALQEGEDISFDQLAHRTGLTPGKLSSRLLELELYAVVKALPGKRYTLLK